MEKLHKILVEKSGTNFVYFQPPSNIQMHYPCVIYNLETLDADYADDKRYKNKRKWSLLIIDKNPDSKIANKLLDIPYCSFNRGVYKASGLYHFPLTLYY